MVRIKYPRSTVAVRTNGTGIRASVQEIANAWEESSSTTMINVKEVTRPIIVAESNP